jgi:hypothetical protein
MGRINSHLACQRFVSFGFRELCSVRNFDYVVADPALVTLSIERSTITTANRCGRNEAGRLIYSHTCRREVIKCSRGFNPMQADHIWWLQIDCAL